MQTAGLPQSQLQVHAVGMSMLAGILEELLGNAVDLVLHHRSGLFAGTSKLYVLASAAFNILFQLFHGGLESHALHHGGIQVMADPADSPMLCLYEPVSFQVHRGTLVVVFSTRADFIPLRCLPRSRNCNG